MFSFAIQGCLMSSSGAPAWTPADDGPLHWLQAPIVGATDFLTLSGTDVESVADAAGGAVVMSKITDARRPVHVQTDELDGYTSLRFSRTASASAGSALRSTTGGITGAVDHEIAMLAKWTGNEVDGAGADCFASFGRSGGFLTSSIGRIYTPADAASLRDFAGGSGIAIPTTYYTSDNAWNLYEKVYDASTQRLIMLKNGRPDFRLDSTNGGYTQCLATGVGAGAIAPDNVEFGYQRLVGGYPIPHTDMIAGLFFDKVRTGTNRAKLYEWIADHFPSRFSYAPTVITVGDSRPWGYGILATDRYSRTVATALGYRDGNSAVGSTTIATALTNLDLSLMCGADGESGGIVRLGKPTVLLCDSGINDLAASRSATDIFADELAIYAAARVEYPTITCVSIVCLPDTGLTGPQETQRAALNALRAGGTNTADHYVAATGSSILTWSATDYFDTVHLNETGHGKLATAIQAVL